MIMLRLLNTEDTEEEGEEGENSWLLNFWTGWWKAFLLLLLFVGFFVCLFLNNFHSHCCHQYHPS